jgi:hypothetical protein
MLLAQHRLSQPQYLSMHLFCLLVFTLITQHIRQVAHARQCVRMPFAQYNLPQSAT